MNATSPTALRSFGLRLVLVAAGLAVGSAAYIAWRAHDRGESASTPRNETGRPTASPDPASSPSRAGPPTTPDDR